MAHEPNSADLWDRVWRDAPDADAHRQAVAAEARTIRWQRIETRVRAAFGDFRALNVIEIGAGAGTNAALMAQRGAQVTLLDYSERALLRARELFAANDVRAELVRANALQFPDALRGTFDVAMSFGLNEHFTGKERVRIFQAHLDALRAGGLAFVSVPNAHNPPYRMFKWVAQTTHRWKLGVEIPFTRAELESICAQLGVREYEFFGDSFLASWQFVNPLRYLRKRTAASRAQRVDASPERGTRLDERWSYATVLMMRKP